MNGTVRAGRTVSQHQAGKWPGQEEEPEWEDGTSERLRKETTDRLHRVARQGALVNALRRPPPTVSPPLTISLAVVLVLAVLAMRGIWPRAVRLAAWLLGPASIALMIATTVLAVRSY